jgi:phosphatidylserine/phosphatidylglycerophosphate/cardiolipin synthase-like enzyme
MRNTFANLVNATLIRTIGRTTTAAQLGAMVAAWVFVAATPASAQEQLLFPAVDNVKNVLLQKINNETVRLDISMWLLGEGEISQAIVRRHQAGVPVRVIGDRGSIFEGDVNTRRQFEYLATNGVPIRIRYHPRHVLQIIHWKTGIFVGQNLVEFGSANWTPFELRPWSATDFKDETAMFTDDPVIVNAFKTKFDQYWSDPNFLDWRDAYRLDAGAEWTAPMTIPRGRLEPDYPTNIPGMIWGQGSELNNALMAEMERETNRIDIVSYRLTVPEVTDTIIRRHNAGVPVRVFGEPTQYRNAGFPEYWLVGAMIDKLLVAGVPVKQRLHQGLTHMKTLITSRVALVASANFTRNWERDHNYFISATGKPHLYDAFRQRFDEMWNDSVNYTDFRPQPPHAASINSPGAGWVEVPLQPRFEWKRAPFAVAYDLYLGTSQSNLARIATVDAQMHENPPLTYGFTPSTPLQPGTTYYWRLVSKTYATAINSSLVASTAVRAFTTAGTGGGTGGGTGPYNGVVVPLPGVIQAENFDEGGSGVGYFDTTSGNSGGRHRTTTDVDIENTADSTGGDYNVGWTAPGEWLKYTVNVASAGDYTVEVRVAAPSGGATFHIEVNGVDRTGPMTVPTTGGWQAWTTVTRTGVPLPGGQQTWRLVIDSASPSGSVGNFNYIRVSSGGGGGPVVPVEPTPFGGTAVPLPGTIEAENFDAGGSGVAYLDRTSGNTGGHYRLSEHVDIGTVPADGGGGYRVGWVDPGEWLLYTVNVSAAGTYDIEARVAASGGGGTFHIEVNGVDRSGPIVIPNSGGWHTYITVRKTGLVLAAGPQVWRVVFDAVGSSGAVGNINWFRVSSPSALAAPDTRMPGARQPALETPSPFGGGPGSPSTGILTAAVALPNRRILPPVMGPASAAGAAGRNVHTTPEPLPATTSTAT